MSVKIEGKYYGTEIDEKWWKRYTKNKLLARGNGTFSYDEQAISFLRFLTRTPITIDLRKILDIKTGKWHSGQWGNGKTIIKILWKNDGQLLSSGFSLNSKQSDLEKILLKLNEAINSIK